MSAIYKHLTAAVLSVLALAYAVLMWQGILDYAAQAFTPAQMLSKQAPAHIPVWLEGTLENVQSRQGEQQNLTHFQLSRDGKSLFALSAQTLPEALTAGAQIAVLGRQPHDCVPDKPSCRLEARAVLPAGSWLKFWSMGGYGLFVWISYALAGVLLLFNFIQPQWHEREIRRALARQQRRSHS